MSDHSPDSLLKKKIATFPSAAGIYKMLDENKKIIYIGKAKNLKKRVASYFTKQSQRKITEILVQKINAIEFITTNNEREALILENNLIKQYQPFFNIDLKDNKTYPYLLLTTHEKFPQLLKTRIKGKKGIYFGPYPNVQVVDNYLKIFNLLYPLKKCLRKKFPANFKPCFYFDLGQCLDYCTGNVPQEKTTTINHEIKTLLGKNKNPLIKKINEQMQIAIKKQNYEKAQLLKESLILIKTEGKQQSVEWLKEDDFDVIDFLTSDKIIVMTILKFRGGKLIQKESFPFKGKFLFSKDSFSPPLKELLSQFLFEFYKNYQEKINQILLSESFFYDNFHQEISEVINQAFALAFPEIINPHFVKVKIPQKGNKLRLLELARANSRYEAIQQKEKPQENEVLVVLRDLLGLPTLPQVIESFDIANTANQGIMGGMVSFYKGKKSPKDYRVFNVKSTAIQDDFKSMEEVITRRYSRLLQEKKKLPDLVLIDGGKGQLGKAQASLTALGITETPVISLAKKKETIFLPRLAEGISLPFSHPVLRLLVSIRDETHRFVNSRHASRRTKETLTSRLTKIKNFGPVKIKKVLQNFQNLEEIKTLSPEEIYQRTKLNKKDIDALLHFL